ncbi:MAG: acetoacetate--CoA ligase [Rhodobacteraceae bacterium]|nr:acetoacetate--CoA ligase [Paracoccaceae bacterium]
MSRKILWSPTPEFAQSSTMAAFTAFAETRTGQRFDSYNDLWEWSISDLEAFWGAIWDFCNVQGKRPDQFLVKNQMPGAEWGAGCELNYAAQIFHVAQKNPNAPALIVQSETFGTSQISWAELTAQVTAVAANLREMGVAKGDRVVAILPNTETALIAFLATASLGAVWSLCAPDMGQVAILDRFRQIEPKVLIAQDGYVHAGKMIDKRAALRDISDGLPSVTHHIRVPVVGALDQGHIDWASLTTASAQVTPVPVAFDHPLWIVYSSGTTGNPTPIVHGHGGIVLEASKQALHHNLTDQDRFMWFTSSGWIMWNAQWMGLGQGATICLYDGAPNHPDMHVVWRFVADQKVTNFGAGAAFFDSCRKMGVTARDHDLSALTTLGSTGSPLSSDVYDWIYADVKSDVWLTPISGGTDLAGAFVGGNPMMPVRAGEMQCRLLGNAARAYDAQGNEVFDEVGELVCTEPLPSMPLYFWGDEDGTRLHDSYFDTYPGVWRHGDWIEITGEGGSVIYGRSDATINRKGLRMGSAEIYQAVEGLDVVMDSLVVDLEFLGRDSFMPLFVVLAAGSTLTDEIKDQINTAIREAVSARFIPNEIVEIPAVPRTLSGKKLEVPVKKLLLGGDPAMVVNRDSMANPESFETFIDYAKAHNAE